MPMQCKDRSVELISRMGSFPPRSYPPEPREQFGRLRKAGGLWEPGSRCWLIERRRINPLIRNLRRVTDPLFRRVGIDLDH
jgi:hypothetical protein